MIKIDFSLDELLPIPLVPLRKFQRNTKRTSNVLTSAENINDLREVRGKKARESEAKEERKKLTASKKEEMIEKQLKKVQEQQEKREKKADDDKKKKEVAAEKVRKRI